jgi:hypothetical protein
LDEQQAALNKSCMDLYTFSKNYEPGYKLKRRLNGFTKIAHYGKRCFE